MMGGVLEGTACLSVPVLAVFGDAALLRFGGQGEVTQGFGLMGEREKGVSNGGEGGYTLLGVLGKGGPLVDGFTEWHPVGTQFTLHLSSQIRDANGRRRTRQGGEG